MTRNDWLKDVIALAEERGFWVGNVKMDMPGGYVDLVDERGGRITISSLGGEVPVKEYLGQLTALKREPRPALYKEVDAK